MEVRQFVSFFFGVVAHSDAVGRGLEENSRRRFEEAVQRYKQPPKDYSIDRQFINEMTLSRLVETFDLYLILILRELFHAKPDMLKSNSSIDAETLLSLKTFDDIISYLAEDKLHELSYKSLSELNKYIQSRTRIPLFKSDEIYNKVLLTTEIRNLIAHNDCRKNDRFEKHVPPEIAATLRISEMGTIILSDEYVNRTSDVLDNVVFDFDEVVAKKYNLETVNRMTSFLFRK
jgi:hypothetical protein